MAKTDFIFAYPYTKKAFCQAAVEYSYVLNFYLGIDDGHMLIGFSKEI